MAQPHEVSHGWMHGRVFTTKKDVPAREHRYLEEEWSRTLFTIPRGTKVKVVMVSRFGDCGITPELEKETGYNARVWPEDLEIKENL